jgi:hypothetical protein
MPSFRAGLIARSAMGGAGVALSNATVAANATIGTTVGTLSVVGGTGTYTYSLTSNPGGLYAISGSSLNVAAALSPGTTPVTVQATGGVPTPLSNVFAITVTPVPTLPANSGGGNLPLISGSTVVGQTLTTTDGTWTGFPAPAFTYQWKRNGANISSATASSYLLVSADAGANMTVTVTATNTAGSANATSLAVGPITDVPSVAAPSLTWTSDALDMTPNFTVDLPSGLGAPSDAVVGDVIYLEITDNAAFTTTSTDALDAGQVTGDLVAMEQTTPLAAGTYYARARLKRGSVYGPYSNVVSKAISPPVVTTTLDPTIGTPSTTFSNGNLTVTGTAGSGANTAKSIASHTAGKYYCEFTCGTITNTGVGLTTLARTVNDYMGNNGCPAVANWSGGWTGGTGGTSTAQVLVTGHQYAMAIDLDNNSYWMKDLTLGGNWNNNVGANPATNALGYTHNLLAAATVLVGVNPGATGDSVTFNFGATAYTGVVPSGYGNW